MKNKFSLILNLSVLALGIAFVALWAKGMGVFDLVSIVVGILFVLFSSWSLVTTFVASRNQKEAASPDSGSMVVSLIPALGGLALGIAMVAASGFFVKILSYLFATLLIIGAIFKFWEIVSARKKVNYPVWVYILPSLLMVCGIVLFAVGIQIVQQWLALIVGIAFIAYSVNSMLEYGIYKKQRRNQKDSNVADAEFEDLPESKE